MKVKNELKIYEINGKDAIPINETHTLHVESHWSVTYLITLRIDDQPTTVTVSADELMKAIKNAINHK